MSDHVEFNAYFYLKPLLSKPSCYKGCKGVDFFCQLYVLKYSCVFVRHPILFAELVAALSLLNELQNICV